MTHQTRFIFRGRSATLWIMTPALTHIALHVRDLDACVAFYRDFCGMRLVHERGEAGAQRVVWLAEPGKERDFIIVLVPGGPGRDQAERDYSHLGFALESREAVDAIAARAGAAGCLVWPPREEPYPVGYYCGVRDPDGNFVEFSYGQPLGPGAPPLPPA
jgi:catechol 2,3-dioxygenase-like lactoylglutathione lyase family enzyme